MICPMTYTDTNTTNGHTNEEIVIATRDHLDTISRLREFNQALCAKLASEQRSHEQRLEDITDRLHDEANARSFCSEFDDFMEELGLRRRTREYEVTLTITATVAVIVEAADADAATEKAEELVIGTGDSCGTYIRHDGHFYEVNEAEVTDTSIA